MEEYLNSISLTDLDMLELALSKTATQNIRFAVTDSLEDHAISVTDGLIENAPKLVSDITIYRIYIAIPELQKGGELQEPAYFAGSSIKPTAGKHEIVIAVTAPAGTPALQLDQDTYVLGRGLKVNLEPTDQNYVLGSFGVFDPGLIVSEPIFLSEEELEAPESSIMIDFVPDVVEFYNKVHDPHSGQFGPGGSGSKSAGTGDGDGKAPGPINRHGGKTLDLGGRTIEGVKGWDEKGKPIPGSDAWIEAHGLSREVFNKRPYVRFQQDPNSPEIAAEYGGYAKDLRIFKKVSSSTSGWIMKRNAAPGSPNPEKIPGQVRPDKKVVLDPGQAARKKAILTNDEKRLADLKAFKPADVIKDREVRLAKAKGDLEQLKHTTPDTIRKDAADKLQVAQANFTKAKTGTDEGRIAETRGELNRAKRAQVRGERIARTWRPDKEQYDAETAVSTAEKRLERAKQDPERAIRTSTQAAERRVIRSQNAYDKTAIKYTFPSQPGSASRLDVHQDPQNLKNLTQGNGRVYWAMEGCIKADSVLTSLKKEDPSAAVISNPSVTLWQNAESAWVAKKYLQGREVVLLPDSDGVKNPDVVRAAKGLQALLQNNGVKDVYVASPPLKDGHIEHFKLRSGHDEERKGIDDHLGAGRGTLGELTFTHQTVPKISLHEYTREGGATGVEKINKNALGSTEAVMTAISSIAGQRGVAKIPKNMLSQASGQPRTNAADARARLEKLGLIKVEYVFNPDALSRGKRVQDMTDERINELVRMKIIKQPRTDEKFTGIEFDESPVITVLHDKHKSVDLPSNSLSSLPSWKPPRGFKGWTSPVLGATASKTGVTKVKASKGTVHTKPGKLIVRSKAGADRYGVPIGHAVPVQAGATGNIGLVSMDNNARILIDFVPVTPIDLEAEAPAIPINFIPVILDSEVHEFYNRAHDRRTGRFAPHLSGPKVTSNSGTEAENAVLDKAHEASKRRALSGGRSGASVELLSGRKGKVIRKSGLSKDDVDREYLAAKVGKALGAPVPTVGRANNSTIVAQYIPGHVAGTFDRDIGRFLPLSRGDRKASVGLKGTRELALMDIAIKNEDRHGGNFLIKADKSVVGIDHTTTFGGKAFLGLRPSSALEKNWKHTFTKAEYQSALKKVKPLEKNFKKLGRKAWYDQMVTRLTEEAAKTKE